MDTVVWCSTGKSTSLRLEAGVDKPTNEHPNAVSAFDAVGWTDVRKSIPPAKNLDTYIKH